MQTSIIPYLGFKGNCREAMEFYHSIFGGNLEIMGYEGTPAENNDNKTKVMHSHLHFDDTNLMAADIMQEGELISGNNITLLIAPPSDEKGQEYFDKLAEKGKVIMPYEDTFWGAKFGMVADQFDMVWSVNYDKEDHKS